MLKQYVVVGFQDDSVAVAHNKWLVKTLEGESACWWPFNNQSTRARKGEVPDKERWMIYSVRIFASADSFEMAVIKSKLALDTSNVESEDQGETQRDSPVNVQPEQSNSPVNVQPVPVHTKSRTIKRPQKYASIPDDSDEDEPPCSSQKVLKLPVPPMLSPLNRSSLAALSPEMDRQLTLSPSVDMTPLDRNFRTESSFRPLNRSLTGEMTRSSLSQSPSTIRSGSSRSSTAPPPLLTPSPGMVRSSMTPSPVVDWSPHNTNNQFLDNLPGLRMPLTRRVDTIEATQRIILENLAVIRENQKEMKEMLGQILSSKSGPKDVIIEDVIQSPAKSEEELLEIIRELENPEFKKKLVNLLSTLGGHKVGDTVRKMLRVLGTNGLWSNYSLKGKKKKNFSELSLCRVVTKSCIKIHRCSVSEVEECIAETLKHAPAQKDGPRYKKRPETNTNQPADQRAEINNLE
ncbi:uncharacterized protein LOC134699797 isoform X2 [Mytilus trossulus]|uniref:uncharacterized protein LOC134699797 isoform X2 n=1 Tax=Mytilus trossulus TaxID=6551 RepID=UPI003003D77F